MPRGTSPLDESNLQGRLWGPQFMTTDLWFDAMDVATVTLISGRVSQWNDKSGNARNVSQTSTFAQPTWNNAGLNGKPSIRFDNNFYSTSARFLGATPAQSVVGVSNISMFMVNRYAAYPGASVPGDQVAAGLGLFSSNGNQRGFFVGKEYWQAASYPYNCHDYMVGNDDLNTGRSVRGTLSADVGGTHHIFEAIQSSSTAVKLFRDGQFDANIDSENALVPSSAVGSNRIGIGGMSLSTSPSRKADIEMSELLMIFSAISDIDRQKIEGYLAWKWAMTDNLPGNHPFKNRPPLISD